MTDSNRATELTPAPTKLGLALELFSSMRFAIALLTLICIASVMGTIVKQHEPLANYVNQFGPFWADVFASIGLYKVYSAWWFLLMRANRPPERPSMSHISHSGLSRSRR